MKFNVATDIIISNRNFKGKMMQLFLIALITFVGSLVQGTSGFGFALVCMSLLPFVIAFKTAVVLEAILAFIMVSYIAIRLYRHIDIRLVIPPAITAGIFSYIGISALIAINDSLLKRIFGVLLVILAFYFVFFSEKVNIKGNVINGMSAGAISGFAGGLFSVGGPPMVVYFMAVTKDKTKYLANMQAFFTINSLTVAIMHMLKGNVTNEMIPMILIALIGVLVGTASGLYLFKKMDAKTVKYLVCALMSVSGIYMIIRG